MTDRPVRDRQVVFVATAVVVAVLGLLALSVYVPVVGEALSAAPLLIVALIVITVVVLVRALRPRTPGD